MKKGIVLTISIIGILLAGAGYAYFQVVEPEAEVVIPTGPHIVVEPATFDFGQVLYGDVPQHTFTVKNTGDQVLEIDGVTTSCACTSGEVSATTIAPGAQVNLVVSFDPAVHGDDTDMGPLTRTVYIATNDVHQPEAEAKIYADVYK